MEEKKRKREEKTDTTKTKKKNPIETLKKQQKIIEGLKKSVTCQICQEIMTLPHNLDCGHAFCYECTYAWFKKSPTCPICRKGITTVPSNSWSIQQQVDLLLESLDEEETKEYQNKLKTAKENSKKNPIKLMKNPNIDPKDQVFRCAECDWELIKGKCSNCGSNHHQITHKNINNETIGDEDEDSEEGTESEVSGLFASDDEDDEEKQLDNADFQYHSSDDEDEDDYESDDNEENPIEID